MLEIHAIPSSGLVEDSINPHILGSCIPAKTAPHRTPRSAAALRCRLASLDLSCCPKQQFCNGAWGRVPMDSIYLFGGFLFPVECIVIARSA